DREAGGLLIGHVVAGNAMGAARIGGHILGIAAGGRSHHAVAGLERRHVAPDRLDLARTFEPEAGSDAANPAVLLAGRDADVGAVEARSAHLDQDLIRRGLGPRDVAHFGALFAD